MRKDKHLSVRSNFSINRLKNLLTESNLTNTFFKEFSFIILEKSFFVALFRFSVGLKRCVQPDFTKFYDVVLT